MGKRISRCVELLEQDQAIYYDGPHSGHVLTHAQGLIDAGTWADYMIVGMEHGAFDMTGLAEYMRGLVDSGPTRSGHRTPAVIVEAPAAGSRVGLGSVVTLDDDGETVAYTIVGADESDPPRGRISSSSPVGRALVGRDKGDYVVVATPAGERRYRILAIG